MQLCSQYDSASLPSNEEINEALNYLSMCLLCKDYTEASLILFISIKQPPHSWGETHKGLLCFATLQSF